MTQEMLLITGSEHQDAGALDLVTSAAARVGLDVGRRRSPKDAVQHLEDAIAASREPALIVLGPDVPRPLAIAREIRRLAPLVHLVFLADADRVTELQREMGLAPRIGTHWTIASLDREGLERALRDGARSTAQRRRMRTTLDRANVQLASRPPADGPDLRRLILSDRHLASILESAQDAILSADTTTRVLTWNRAAERLFGLSPIEAIGRPLSALLGGDEVISPAVLHEALAGHLEGRRSSVCRRKDGSVFDAEVTLAPVRDEVGRPFGLSAIVRDVTERKRAEDEVRRQREWLQVTLTSIGDAVIATDTGGRVTFLNPVAEALTGWGQAEAVGRALEEVFPIINEHTRKPVEHPVTKVMREGGIVGLANHTLLIARDGTERPIDDSAAPIRDAAGEIAGVVLVFRDVSEKKEAERAFRESQERFAAIFEQVMAGVAQTDLTGRFLMANKRFCEIVDRPIEELLTLRMQEITYPDDLPQNLELFQRMVTGGPNFTMEKRYQRPDGSTVWVDVSVTMFKDADGAPLGTLAVVIDITARKQAEEELRRRVEQLAEEGRRKNEFLALLGHELRNPLAPLKNGIEILGGLGCDDARVEPIRAMMDRQVRQLTRLVDDLLDTSRVNRGLVQLRKERVLLADVVSRAVETTQPIIKERSHTLTVTAPEQPVWLDGDPVRLEQILGNLLTNAARYTEPGGRIFVTAEREGEQAVVRVQDSGIGIRPEMLTHIFDMFTQADRVPGRVHEGLGIGLTLVKSLVEMHGGSVEALSAGPGKGSEFVVRLPVAQQPEASVAEEAERAQESEARGRPLRILVVDDNEDAAESLSMLLTLYGHDVRTAPDGPAALEQARAWVPEVILLDIGLPKGMSGYDVARRIRADPRISGARLVALSGFGQDEDRRKSREAGFDHHLTKPAEPDVLEALIASMASARPDR
jgi:PAS domain S-box-containing protein